ncbi:SusC/RagA family TonB-linked outer membrane protein [Hymenobacter sp. B81]|uniref:SusC/RagA family TonB-linked outer membrane protein n=1 Tax=Hymenobacter sp. B81 TaxID=3344878 RepID=UPI0037DC32B1
MKQPYTPKLWFLLFLLVCCSLSAAAQTGAISGRLLDDKNLPLPGVTVLVEGTQLGTSTNSEGGFLIQNVPAGPQTVVASFVGYTTKRLPVTVTAGQTATIADATLAENTTLLSEAVVVGYGTQRRQDVTGSVATVTEREFVQGQISTPEQLINGKVAGVQITSNGGAPGSGSAIRIRGGASLNASNDPLIVIDGVPVDNTELAGSPNALSLINPNDIETMTVLKDASATAIYGSRGSNGVILITTKKGLAGEKIRVNFNTQFSVAKNTRKIDVLSADEFRRLINDESIVDATGNPYSTPVTRSFLGTANTDWQDVIYRTAYTTDNNLSVTGNAGPLPYRVSVGYLNQNGVLKTNNLERKSVSIGITPVLLDGHLRVDANVKGSIIDNRFADAGVITNAIFFNPTLPVFNDSARYAPYGGYQQYLTTANAPQGLAPSNPLARLEQRRDLSTVKRSIGNLQLDYKLHFLPDLRANLNLGYDISRSKGSTFVPATEFSEYNNRGVNNRYSQDRDNKLLEFYLNYGKDLPNELGRLEVLGGYSYQDFIRYRPFEFNYNANRELVNPAQVRDNDSKSQNTLVSFYSRVNYNLKDRYLFTGTLRADGSSRFANNKWGYFPAAALAWRVKGENFLVDNTTFSELKFRVGYGITGQQDVGDDYPALARYSQGSGTVQYQLGDQYYTTLRPASFDPNIKWEETTTYNAGLDYGFFDGRLLGTVDVYLRKTEDLLNRIETAAGSNLSNRVLTNIGSLENRGVELGLTGIVAQGEKFNWTLNANATFNRNKLTRLNLVDNPSSPGVEVGGVAGGTGTNIQINSIGFPINSFYVYEQVYENGRPVDNKFVDRNGDGTITPADRYRYKSPNPQAVLGLGSNLTYGKASLAFTLRSYLGNYVYDNVNSNAANFASIYPAQPFVRNSTRDILETRFTGAGTGFRQSDYYLKDASFVRMDNLTVGYDLGSLIKESTNLRVSVAVQNVFVLTKYEGIDPEIFNGIDNNFYPRPRTVTFGLNVGF